MGAVPDRRPARRLTTTSIAGTLTATGLASSMRILRGFPTALAKDATDARDYPFGIWPLTPSERGV